MAIARLRTIKQVADYFKEHDPETGVTEWALRRLVKEGEIPVVKVGVKQLINLDVLIDSLNYEEEEQEKIVSR